MPPQRMSNPWAKNPELVAATFREKRSQNLTGAKISHFCRPGIRCQNARRLAGYSAGLGTMGLRNMGPSSSASAAVPE